MEEKPVLPRTATHVTRGCLVVPLQGELYDDVLLHVQKDILKTVQKIGVKGIIIDVSGIDIMDSFCSQTISDTAKMASLLGATTILTGLQPGVVASLVDLDFEFEGLQTAINLEEGFRRLEPIVWPEEAEESIEDEEEHKGEEDSTQRGPDDQE